MKDWTDEELMLAYQGGDLTAFNCLYKRHKDSVYRYLRRQCESAGIADEIFQETWASIIKARQNYLPSAKFSTYLYRIAHNRLIDQYRRTSKVSRENYPSDEQSVNSEEILENHSNNNAPEAAVISEQLKKDIKREVSGLPREQREAFLLQNEGDFTLQQIAEITNTSRETVKSRLRYAYDKLRIALEVEA